MLTRMLTYAQLFAEEGADSLSDKASKVSAFCTSKASKLTSEELQLFAEEGADSFAHMPLLHNLRQAFFFLKKKALPPPPARALSIARESCYYIYTQLLLIP
jgi:hypothetical protein